MFIYQQPTTLSTTNYWMTYDVKFTDLIGNILCNRRYFFFYRTAKKAVGGIRRMVFHKALCYHLYYSTFIRMSNQYTRTRGVLSTQMTCGLRHRMYHLRRPSQPSATHYITLTDTILETTIVATRKDRNMRIPYH